MPKLNIPLIVALLIGAVGAAVSLLGLVAMFGATFAPIAIGLEIGKVTSAATLHKSWQTLGRCVRYTLTGIVALLVVLTSSGIYGFALSRYQAHIAAIEGPVAERVAAADADIERQTEKLADLDKQITTTDSALIIDTAPQARPRTAAAIAAQARAQVEAAKQRRADEQRRQATRDALTAKRDVESAELTRLRTVRAEIQTQKTTADAEVGPMRLIADSIGVDVGKVVAISVASLYDLLATLLLLVSSHNPAAPAKTKPAVPKKSIVAKRKASKRMFKAWDTRRERARQAAFKRGPVAVN
jgi:hypothetical protein